MVAFNTSAMIDPIAAKVGEVLNPAPKTAGVQAAEASGQVINTGQAPQGPLPEAKQSALARVNWKWIAGALVVAGIVYYVATRRNPIAAVGKAVEGVVK